MPNVFVGPPSSKQSFQGGGEIQKKKDIVSFFAASLLRSPDFCAEAPETSPTLLGSAVLRSAVLDLLVVLVEGGEVTDRLTRSNGERSKSRSGQSERFPRVAFVRTSGVASRRCE